MKPSENVHPLDLSNQRNEITYVELLLGFVREIALPLPQELLLVLKVTIESLRVVRIEPRIAAIATIMHFILDRSIGL